MKVALGWDVGDLLNVITELPAAGPVLPYRWASCYRHLVLIIQPTQSPNAPGLYLLGLRRQCPPQAEGHWQTLHVPCFLSAHTPETLHLKSRHSKNVATIMVN